MPDISPAVALFRRHHEFLLERFLDMERSKMPSERDRPPARRPGDRIVRE